MGQDITRWRPAEYGLWTIAATLLEIKRDDGNVFVCVHVNQISYYICLQSNRIIISGGLATTDESHIVFRQPSYELEAFRATLLSARMSLSQQVRRAVKRRNSIAT